MESAILEAINKAKPATEEPNIQSPLTPVENTGNPVVEPAEPVTEVPPVATEEQEVEGTETEPFEFDESWGDTSAPANTEYDKLLKDFGIEKLDSQSVYEKIRELSEKKAEPDPIYNDPLVQKIIDIRKNGGDIQQLINTIGVDDPSKLSPDELFRREAQKWGLTGEELEEAVSDFEAKPNWEKARETNAIRSELQKEKEQRLEQYAASVRAEQEKQKAIVQKAEQDLKSIAESYTGKELYGTPVTKELLDKTMQAINTFNGFRKADGTIDAEHLFRFMFRANNAEAIVKTNVLKAQAKGKKAIIDDITQPSRTATVRTTPTPQNASKAENIINALRAERGK